MAFFLDLHARSLDGQNNENAQAFSVNLNSSLVFLPLFRDSPNYPSGLVAAPMARYPHHPPPALHTAGWKHPDLDPRITPTPMFSVNTLAVFVSSNIPPIKMATPTPPLKMEQVLPNGSARILQSQGKQAWSSVFPLPSFQFELESKDSPDSLTKMATSRDAAQTVQNGDGSAGFCWFNSDKQGIRWLGHRTQISGTAFLWCLYSRTAHWGFVSLVHVPAPMGKSLHLELDQC